MEPLRPHDPRQIGSHLLLARLGDGGMGEVFLGRSPGGRALAVKVIHAALAGDADFRARFRREVTAARAVTGAFTAPVIDADPDAAWPWLATTFLPGMSLDEAVTVYGPLPFAAGYVLGANLAEALSSIHQAGVVHRDLKPSNIILTSDGPRVIDFGIARAADSATITQTGVVVGSPRFMSPEQATTGDAGPAGDVFALGAVITYAVTGSPPFGEGSIPELVYRIAHQRPHLGAVADPALQALIAKCLEKDPARRPTPSAVAAELVAAQSRPGFVPGLGAVPRPGPHPGPQTVPQGLGWLPPPVAAAIAQRTTHPLPQSPPPHGPAPQAPTLPPGRRRGVGRRAVILGGAATAAALAVGGTTVALVRGRDRSAVLWSFEMPEYLRDGPIPAGDLLIAVGPETSAIDRRTGEQRWRAGTRPFISTSPAVLDGRCFLYDGSSLNCHDLATGRLRWSESVKVFGAGLKPAAMGGIVCVPASPEVGEYVIYAMDTATGERRWQYELEQMVTVNAVASDGVVYTPSGGRFLYAVDAATGRLRWQAPTGGKVMSTPVVAGGLVVVTAEDQGVLAYDAATGERRWRTAVKGDVTESVTPAVVESTVYVGHPDGTLTALNAGDGRERWRFTVGGPAPQGTPAHYSIPAVANGLALVHDHSGALFAIDAGSAQLRWRSAIADPTGGPPVLMDGAVYVAGRDGVSGFDLTTGRGRFRFGRSDVPENKSASASHLSGSNGVLYCALGSRDVYALRP